MKPSRKMAFIRYFDEVGRAELTVVEPPPRILYHLQAACGWRIVMGEPILPVIAPRK